MSDFLFASWRTLAGVALVTAAMYVTTLGAVRIAGRRTVAQMSAFDIVITIAVGSVLGSTAVSQQPRYAAGVTALVTLLALQMVIGALRRRSAAARRLLDFPPQVVVRDGELVTSPGLFGAQVTEGEVRSAMRRAGAFDLDGVRVVVLEPAGGVSINRWDDPPPDDLDA